MSSSSADLGRGLDVATSVLPAGQAAALAARPARLDRQLAGGRVGPLYADPQLEELVSRAAALACEQARAEGFALGWAQGRQAAARQAEADHEQALHEARAAQAAFAARARSALGALDAAGRTHREAMSLSLAEVGEAIADGALEIAAAALGRELAEVDAEVAEAVRTALRALGTSDVTVVHIHPQDLQALAALPAGSLPGGLRLQPDASVTRGAALAVSASRQVLAHLPAALAAASEVLRP